MNEISNDMRSHAEIANEINVLQAKIEALGQIGFIPPFGALYQTTIIGFLKAQIAALEWVLCQRDNTSEL
jgi:hypothetical protein